MTLAASTFSSARQTFIATLVNLGIELSEARREAEMAFLFVTGLAAHELLMRANENLPELYRQKLDEILAQRVKRVPIQYALGEAYFMGLKFAVGPGVLIPRCDTECLVETCRLQIEDLLQQNSTVQLLEVGAGSGAIVVSLLKHYSALTATAFEISPLAAHFCRINAICHGVADRLNLIEGDYLEGLPRLSGKFDLFVSNPPYIPLDVARTLAPEVLQHEPTLALVGAGPDGLGFYRSFASLLPGLDATNRAAVFVEMGDEQNQAIEAIFTDAGYRDIVSTVDLSGRPRVMAARAGDKTI